MLAPHLPADEQTRLHTLYELKILETPIEERFERITRLTKQLFKVPIVAISLVDEHRQWFKSIQGLNACETSREVSFCGHTILQDEIFIVEDALQDERFFDNPLVIEAPYIRFYAGFPIRTTSGKVLGTLCLIDTVPRCFTQEELSPLKELAGLVEVEINSQEVCHAQLKLLEEIDQVRLTSMVDPLTRLWNREGIERILKHEIGNSEENALFFGVAMIDIDFFKKINDTYGHPIGDEILRDFAKFLISSCRDTDGAGRWGGEEFIVLINSSSVESITTYADRIRGSVDKAPFQISNGKKIHITVTIGLSLFEPGKNMSAGDLIEIADKALYLGKNQGRNQIVWGERAE